MSQAAKQNTEINEADLRAQGLIPKTVWVFDVDAPGFKERCLLESQKLAEADSLDPTIESFTEAAFLEVYNDPEWQ